jgi:hypothetical protein
MPQTLTCKDCGHTSGLILQFKQLPPNLVLCTGCMWQRQRLAKRYVPQRVQAIVHELNSLISHAERYELDASKIHEACELLKKTLDNHWDA